MTIADVLCGAVLLPAIGVMASVLSRPKSAERAPDKHDASLTGPERTALRSGLKDEVEVLRAVHQVRLVDGKDEGADVAHLPAGVYGFTYSPLQANPMFRKKGDTEFRGAQAGRLQRSSGWVHDGRRGLSTLGLERAIGRPSLP